MDNDQSTSKRKAEKVSTTVIAVTSSSSSSKKQRKISHGEVIGSSSGVGNHPVVSSPFGHVFDDEPHMLAKTLLLPWLDPASATRFGMTCRTYHKVVKDYRRQEDERQNSRSSFTGTLYWQKVIPTKLGYSRHPEDLPEGVGYYVYQKNHYATFFRNEDTKRVTVILMSFCTYAWAISPRGKVKHDVPSVYDMVLDEIQIHLVCPITYRSQLSEQWKCGTNLLEFYASQSYMKVLGREIDLDEDFEAFEYRYFIDGVVPAIWKSVALIRHPNFDMKRSFLDHLPAYIAKGIKAMIQQSHDPIESGMEVIVSIPSNFNGSDSLSDDDSSFSPSVDGEDDSYEDHQLYQKRSIKVYYPPPSREDDSSDPSEEEEEEDEVYESCDDEDGNNPNEGVPDEDICVNYEEECDSYYSETDSLVADVDLMNDVPEPNNNTVLEFSYVPPRSNTDQSPYDFVPPLGDSEFDPNDRFSESGRWYTWQILGKVDNGQN